MNENITDFIFEISAVAMFIAALSLFIIINRASLLSIDVAKESTNNNILVYEGNYNAVENETYYGYEIVASIIRGLDYDIYIDANLIGKDDAAQTVDLSIIELDKSYNYKLVIDRYGVINYIQYY
jgi:hypothetical protein